MYNGIEKVWFAVMMDREDQDWGWGSADLSEAKAMLREALKRNPEAYIVVIDDGSDPVAVDEITADDLNEEGMKYISLDNGNTYLTADEAMQEITDRNLWEQVVELMDDDTREQVHAELAPCTEEEFLTRYLELAPADLIVG